MTQFDLEDRLTNFWTLLQTFVYYSLEEQWQFTPVNTLPQTHQYHDNGQNRERNASEYLQWYEETHVS